MKIGYEDSFDYDYPQNNSENKLIYKANSFTYYLYDFEIEVIDLAEVFNQNNVTISNLKYLDLVLFEVELLNLDILKDAHQLEFLRLGSIELNNLTWINSILSLRKLRLTFIDTLPQKEFLNLHALVNLEYLDLFGCNIDDSAIFINKKETIFHHMTRLKYLSLRDNMIKNRQFVNDISSQDVLLNFLDSVNDFDLSENDNIRLVTIMRMLDGSKYDILKSKFV